MLHCCGAEGWQVCKSMSASCHGTSGRLPVLSVCQVRTSHDPSRVRSCKLQLWSTKLVTDLATGVVKTPWSICKATLQSYVVPKQQCSQQSSNLAVQEFLLSLIKEDIVSDVSCVLSVAHMYDCIAW